MLKFNQFKNAFEERNKSLISEGLINSISYSLFIDKLKDILNKNNMNYLDMVKFDDGIKLIDLKPFKNKIFYNDLISLLNLSGYYISNYKKDKNNIKYDNIGIKTYMNSNNLSILFNKKFDYLDFGIKIKLFHVTDEKFINKIKENGLIPKTNKMIDNHPHRIYLFDNIKDLDFFIEQKIKYDKTFEPKKLVINVKSLPKLKLYKDPKYPNVDVYYTYDNIPSYCIE